MRSDSRGANAEGNSWAGKGTGDGDALEPGDGFGWEGDGWSPSPMEAKKHFAQASGDGPDEYY